MSNMIPNRAGRDSLVFSNLIRVWESDRTVRERILDDAAVITEERTAKASAISAEETNGREKLMMGGDRGERP